MTFTDRLHSGKGGEGGRGALSIYSLYLYILIKLCTPMPHLVRNLQEAFDSGFIPIASIRHKTAILADEVGVVEEQVELAELETGLGFSNALQGVKRQNVSVSTKVPNQALQIPSSGNESVMFRASPMHDGGCCDGV